MAWFMFAGVGAASRGYPHFEGRRRIAFDDHVAHVEAITAGIASTTFLALRRPEMRPARSMGVRRVASRSAAAIRVESIAFLRQPWSVCDSDLQQAEREIWR
jgi:hypothetical protein